ncbi:MAG TPA: OpgC domain-containing protein [Myxococcales bacterium]|nr:OpgC domain-containing protein [Myxococcales bacterium]
MITAHVGSKSNLDALLNLPLLVDPAGPFVLLSGLVLGRGMQAHRPASAVLRRAARLYVIGRDVGLHTAQSRLVPLYGSGGRRRGVRPVRLLRAVYTLSALGVGYVVIVRLLKAARGPLQAVLERLEVLGQKSLYCFVVHLPVALVASAFLLGDRPRILQDAAALAALAFVYGMARARAALEPLSARGDERRSAS